MKEPDVLFEAVSYDLPKARIYPKIRGLRAREAWATMRAMLDNWTDPTLLGHAITLDVRAADEWTAAPVAQACLEEARSLFGPCRAPEQPATSWQIPPERLEDAIEFALSDERWPRQRLGPIRLSFGYRFNWLAWRDPLPAPLSTWIHGISSIGFILESRSLAVSPDFTIPAPYDSPECQSFIAALQAALPFELKPQYFSRMLVNTRTGGIRRRRLDDA